MIFPQAHVVIHAWHTKKTHVGAAWPHAWGAREYETHCSPAMWTRTTTKSWEPPAYFPRSREVASWAFDHWFALVWVTMTPRAEQREGGLSCRWLIPVRACPAVWCRPSRADSRVLGALIPRYAAYSRGYSPARRVRAPAACPCRYWMMLCFPWACRSRSAHPSWSRVWSTRWVRRRCLQRSACIIWRGEWLELTGVCLTLFEASLLGSPRGACACMRGAVEVCVYVWICGFVYVFVHVFVRTYMYDVVQWEYVHVWEKVSICMCMCVGVHVCIFTQYDRSIYMIVQRSHVSIIFMLKKRQGTNIHKQTCMYVKCMHVYKCTW